MSLEELRQENMKRNAEMLAAFQFDEMIAPFQPRRSSLGTPASKRPKLVSKSGSAVKPSELAPPRRSLRMLNLPAVSYDQAALEAAAMKEELEEHKPHQPMTLADCLDPTATVDDLVNVFHGLDSSSSWQTPTDGRHEESLAKLAKRISRLRMDESCVAKMTQTRATAVAFHPAADKALLMVGGRAGDLAFWETSRRDAPPVALQPHLNVVSMVACHPQRPHQVVTTSYDGAVRTTDIHRQMALLTCDLDTMVCSMDFLSPHSILRGDNAGLATVTDLRDDQDQKGPTFKCYDRGSCNVKAISVNRQREHLVSVATNAGSVLLWDIRNPAECLVNLPHIRTVQWCEFSSRGNALLTSSSSDQVRVYDVGEVVKGVRQPARTIPHNNNTGRYTTPFRPRWLPHREDCFIIGSMSHPRKIEFYNAKSGARLAVVTDELMQSINPISVFHPSLNILAGVNSSGRAHVLV